MHLISDQMLRVDGGCMKVSCKRCQGNGEIVIDWAAYLHPTDLTAEEASVAECPDCGGDGAVEEAEEQQRPPVLKSTRFEEVSCERPTESCEWPECECCLSARPSDNRRRKTQDDPK